MGTALVMEHANALAQMIVSETLTSLQGPLRDEGYRRYRELFEKCLPELVEKLSA